MDLIDTADICPTLNKLGSLPSSRDLNFTNKCNSTFSGEAERSKQTCTSSSGGDKGLGAPVGREDKGDLEDLAADHCQEMGRLPQRIHPRLWRLPRPILQCADNWGRAYQRPHCRLHWHHLEAEAEEGEIWRGRERGGSDGGIVHQPRPGNWDSWFASNFEKS